MAVVVVVGGGRANEAACEQRLRHDDRRVVIDDAAVDQQRDSIIIIAMRGDDDDDDDDDDARGERVVMIDIPPWSRTSRSFFCVLVLFSTCGRERIRRPDQSYYCTRPKTRHAHLHLDSIAPAHNSGAKCIINQNASHPHHPTFTT